MESLDLELTPRRITMLVTFSLATALLLPASQFWIGGALLAVCAFLVATDPVAKLRRRLFVLIGCIVILAATDINPSLSNENFLQVGIPFGLVVFLPALIQHFGDRGVIRYRFWPVHWRWQDIVYVIVSIPLAWVVLAGYEWGNRFLFDDELFRSWTLPPEPDPNEIRRLFIGINLVGIWDELFFVNTCFALLRSLFRFPIANFVQAVIYTAVLYDMAFDGCGLVIVFLFA